MKKEDSMASETNESAQRDDEPNTSKRELLKKAWVAPVAVTLAALPLNVHSGTTTAAP